MTIGPFSGLLCACCVVAGMYTTFRVGDLRINWSPSLPPGLYQRNPQGNLALFCLEEPYAALAFSRGYREDGSCPDGGQPLLKPIVARAGDVVEVSPAGVSVNGRQLRNSAPQAKDSAGRPMEHWPYGYYVVGSGEVWLVSTFELRSFDSRYFGPVAVSAIQATYRPLVTTN